MVWKDTIVLHTVLRLILKVSKSCNEYKTASVYFYTCFFGTVIMADRTFNCAKRGKYTLEEKDALEKLCEKYKLEYDKKLNSTSRKVTYNK